MPVGGADTEGPGKRLALGMERVSGWKETDGDTGPRGDVRLEAMPAGGKIKGKTQTHRTVTLKAQSPGIRELKKGLSSPAQVPTAPRPPNILPWSLQSLWSLFPGPKVQQLQAHPQPYLALVLDLKSSLFSHKNEMVPPLYSI